MVTEHQNRIVSEQWYPYWSFPCPLHLSAIYPPPSSHINPVLVFPCLKPLTACHCIKLKQVKSLVKMKIKILHWSTQYLKRKLLAYNKDLYMLDLNSSHFTSWSRIHIYISKRNMLQVLTGTEFSKKFSSPSCSNGPHPNLDSRLVDPISFL